VAMQCWRGDAGYGGLWLLGPALLLFVKWTCHATSSGILRAQRYMRLHCAILQ
jgi:hypothetical protein